VSPQSDKATDPGRVPAAATIPPPIGCVEAECAVLGALLQVRAVEAHGVTLHLLPADFVDPRHVAVLEVIIELSSDSVAPDPVLVVGALRRTGRERCFTDDRSPAVYLADLLEAAPCIGSIGHYAQVVVEHSARRRAQSASVRIEQVAGLSDLDTCRQVTLDELEAVYAAFDRLAAVQ